MSQTPLAHLEDDLAAAPDRRVADAISARIASLETAALAPTATVLLEAARHALEAAQPAAAVADLDSALVLQPDSVLLWRERAVARVHTGDLDGAIADLGEAIDRDSRDEAAWNALSRITELHGEPKGAFAAWQRVLILEPAVPDGALRLDELRKKAFGEPA